MESRSVRWRKPCGGFGRAGNIFDLSPELDDRREHVVGRHLAVDSRRSVTPARPAGVGRLVASATASCSADPRTAPRRAPRRAGAARDVRAHLEHDRQVGLSRAPGEHRDIHRARRRCPGRRATSGTSDSETTIVPAARRGRPRSAVSKRSAANNNPNVLCDSDWSGIA